MFNHLMAEGNQAEFQNISAATVLETEAPGKKVTHSPANPTNRESEASGSQRGSSEKAPWGFSFLGH